MTILKNMINTSLTLGPFTIPHKLLFFIGAAAVLHLLLFIIKRKDRETFKKASDLFFNSIILFLPGWRLSLILTNWSTFKEAPAALLYLPGGLMNYLAGALLVGISVLLFIKQRKYSRNEFSAWGILTGGTLILFFLLNSVSSMLPAEIQDQKTLTDSDTAVEKIFLLTMEGDEQSLELSGSPVTIVNFWASWCPPCRAEIPEIDRFYADYRDKEIRLITVNMTSTEKSMENVYDFIEKQEADFPVLMDHKGEAAAYFNINSVPSTFVFNSRGELIAQKTGAVDYGWLKKSVKSPKSD